jgi:hypothetical protein
LKRVQQATGIKREKSRFTKVDAAIREQATLFEEETHELAGAADRIIRKHGKNIIGKQFATRRLADIMCDLFVHGCVLSRVNESIKANGVANATKEIEILHVFSGQVRRRIRGNYNKIDNNDDELIKSLADHAFENERYVWDNL